MIPTADEIAVAVVEACRETAEDPIACAQGEMMIRGRHYALHALARVYPEAHALKLVRLVGVKGDAMEFWRNSKRVAGRNGNQKAARWWSPAVLTRVVDAVFKVAEKRTVKPEAVERPIEEPAPKLPSPAPRRPDAGVTRIAKAVEARKPLPPAPRVERPADPPPRVFRPSPGGIGAGKRDLYQMLGDAVRNTAKLQKDD